MYSTSLSLTPSLSSQIKLAVGSPSPPAPPPPFILQSDCSVSQRELQEAGAPSVPLCQAGDMKGCQSPAPKTISSGGLPHNTLLEELHPALEKGAGSQDQDQCFVLREPG